MSPGHVTITALAAVDCSRLIVAVITAPFRRWVAAFWKERPWPRAITGVETKRPRSRNGRKTKPWQPQTRSRQSRRSLSGGKRPNSSGSQLFRHCAPGPGEIFRIAIGLRTDQWVRSLPQEMHRWCISPSFHGRFRAGLRWRDAPAMCREIRQRRIRVVIPGRGGAGREEPGRAAAEYRSSAGPRPDIAIREWRRRQSLLR